MATLLLSVMGAFAEFERALIRERQREGIALAKQRGAYRGRTRSLAAGQVGELTLRAAAGEAKTTLAQEFGISRETVYQYLLCGRAGHAALNARREVISRRTSPLGSTSVQNSDVPRRSSVVSSSDQAGSSSSCSSRRLLAICPRGLSVDG